MAFFTQILNVPFAQLWLKHPFLAALAVFGCVFLLTAASALFAARRLAPIHEEPPDRPPSSDEVVLVQGAGSCQHVAAGDMLQFPLKVRTRLNLGVTEAKLSGASFVMRGPS